jgi:TldD protein
MGINDFNLSMILKKALKNGGLFADIYYERSIPTSIILDDNRIEKVISGIDEGVGIRVVDSKYRVLYAYTNEIEKESLLKLADNIAVMIKEKIYEKNINIMKRVPSLKLPISKLPDTVDINYKIEIVKRGNDRAVSMDKRVRQVKVVYRDLIKNVAIANSDGLYIEDDRVETLFFIQVVAYDNGVIQTGYEAVGGAIGIELFDENTPEDVAEKSARRGLMMLTAKKAPSGKMPVVLSSEAGGTMIHEAIGHGLEADLAMDGLSVYSNKLGERVASPQITVIDDSTIPHKRGSFSFDDEGIESQKTVLLDKGILVNYLYDRVSAMKYNTKPTGNGRRESYQFQPIPRMSNTFIAPGDSNPVDIIKDTYKGLFVKKMGGGQVNTVNGDFVFEVSEGYLIENGKIGEPVRGATLTGNGPKILKIIDKVGNDLGFSLGTCGKDGQGVPVGDAQPTLRIPEIVVGGERLEY